MKILASTGTVTACAGLVAATAITTAAFVLLVRVELSTVNGLDVFSQRRRIRVPLCTTRSFADVRFLIGVRSVLMLRSVASVTESFAAAWILAGIWFLAGMRSEMSLQILQS